MSVCVKHYSKCFKMDLYLKSLGTRPLTVLPFQQWQSTTEGETISLPCCLTSIQLEWWGSRPSCTHMSTCMLTCLDIHTLRKWVNSKQAWLCWQGNFSLVKHSNSLIIYIPTNCCMLQCTMTPPKNIYKAIVIQCSVLGFCLIPIPHCLADYNTVSS